MAKFARELLVLGCKLEILNMNIKKEEEEKQTLESEVSSIRAQLVNTNQFLNRQIIVEGSRSGSELAEDIITLEAKVTKLEENAIKQACKLREMWECKEGHKAKALQIDTNLNSTIRDLTVERDRYKEDMEKYTGVKNELIDDNARLTDDLIGANEEIKEILETMKDVKNKHIMERADINRKI